MKRDLAVAYRVYPGISKRPAYHSQDKFALSSMCLQSFREACGSLNVKIWVLLDGCPPEYESLFRDTLKGFEIEIVAMNSVGNLGTFGKQIDILTSQSDSEYVFLAEDDYFYLPNALQDMLALLASDSEVDFVTPYDHPDSYHTSSRYERHLVKPFGGRYWRTASSTCLTFMTSRHNLIRTQATFRSFTVGNMDCPIWLALTQKLELLNLRVHWDDWFRVKTWLKTFRWGYHTLFLGRRYRLWTPLPALATHLESTCLSPLVDWESIFSSFENRV